MAAFLKLEDSPMFQKQICSLEQTAEEVRDRCQKLYKGCKKFMEALEEAFMGDTAFADSLEAFGVGQDDPISVSIGGPVISKFTSAFRELATYKELLRSQVEHVLIDRLMHFISVDLQDVKAREKFVSLKKSTRGDIVADLEEELHNSKSAFERSRFNLVNALMNVESKKKYEFLESLSTIMDAHLRYFKLGYELLSQMEPFIHQVLTYAQQSKELASIEQDKLAKRIQEFRTQVELDELRASTNMEASTTTDGIHIVGMTSYKNIEAIMQSSAKGEVQTIKQGYLLKRSSSLRGDWKRRFFVLDSYGTLFYYRNKGTKSMAENAADRMDWINKITGVIASLLNSHFLQQPGTKIVEDNKSSGDVTGGDHVLHSQRSLDGRKVNEADCASRILREIPGNDLCAECGAPEPDWASLNLGIVLCIECSGVHRNLGVHVSKVRSIRLDVKVWEPTVLDLFCRLGNAYSNSVWEELLLLQNERMDASNASLLPVRKPSPKDAIYLKEKYIQAKYVEKLLVRKPGTISEIPSHSRIWEVVEANNLREVYRLIVTLGMNTINIAYDEAVGVNMYHHVEASDSQSGCHSAERKQHDPATCQRIKDSNDPKSCLQGCSLLHLACHHGDPVMLELLLQFGANINMRDFHGRTPLHHCISKGGDNQLAKFLLRRGARASIKDDGGLSVLERAMEMGAITDEELFVLLVESE
ncbi:ADP-ribosylation factor GTPase-activating protein AGD4-like isoform X6 [Malania oleifera]|uniref:ADP-ribosylation factor GTPase-activating protein AGD4-like isoform X6 n=1 Tax=Malania oleifera TaxID=397392 RepID=UPI0025AE9E26|nr:ADP-ribosylation factor GTPase-activating protein AGD4-like isoform X6 [Malania oleifera]